MGKRVRRGIGARRPERPSPGPLPWELPASRAFVVQLPAGGVEEKPVFGRVEHVMSGRSRRFEGMEQLAEFFAEVLAIEQQKAFGADED